MLTGQISETPAGPYQNHTPREGWGYCYVIAPGQRLQTRQGGRRDLPAVPLPPCNPQPAVIFAPNLACMRPQKAFFPVALITIFQL